jgi:hypothetical protein
MNTGESETKWETVEWSDGTETMKRYVMTISYMAFMYDYLEDGIE